MDDKIDVTLFVISIQYLHKHNNNRINVIKSLKKKIKTLFQKFVINRDKKEE